MQTSDLSVFSNPCPLTPKSHKSTSLQEDTNFHKLSIPSSNQMTNLAAKVELSLIPIRKFHHPLKDFNTNLSRKKVPHLT